jgi:hypothetical protein
MGAAEEVIEPEKFICETCGVEAKSNAGLAAHMRAKHKPDEIVPEPIASVETETVEA